MIIAKLERDVSKNYLLKVDDEFYIYKYFTKTSNSTLYKAQKIEPGQPRLFTISFDGVGVYEVGEKIKDFWNTADFSDKISSKFLLLV